MPVVAGSEFVDALLRPDRSVGRIIFKWQNTVIKNEFTVQDMTRRRAVSLITREVKQELRDANDTHLDRLRTGFFDKIYLEGARSTSPDFVMLPTDRGAVQRLSLEHYMKMRNARSYAARDSERFVNHVWEDTQSRRKRFGRTTNYLGKSMFKAGRGGALGPDVLEMNQVNIDRRYGVKAAMGSDGRQWGLERYARLQGDAYAQKLHNLGALAGAERERLKGKQVTIIVHDGPDCGWTYHADPLKANGLRVSIEDARANPIAHPHCVRRFSISTKKDDREKMSRQKSKVAKAVKGVVLGAAVTGLSAYAASAVSNMAAAAGVRFLGSQLFEDWLNHLRRLIAQGDMTAQTLFNRALTLQERFLPNWDEVVIARARAIDISTRRPLEFKVQRAWPGGPEWSSLPIEIDRLRAAGDRILYHAEHVGDDAKRFLNTILPGHRDEEQLQLLFESTNKMLRSRENRANLRSVINAEIQRRNLVHRVLLKLPGGEQFASKVSMTWTSWGERLRLDPFDWLRGHVNFTPTGLIKSLSFFPKTAYRGVIKMYQDGSIGGHISALPKNFLNGIFRAIVEIDEHGALVGNIRIVPKGPLNVTFNFITRMPKEVADNLADEFTHYLMLTRGDVIHNMSARMVADHLVDFLGSHASPLGFKPRDLAYGVARRLTEEGLVTGPLAKDLTEQIIARGAQLTFDPRDIYTAARTFGAARVARDLGYVVRQFKFHSAKVEWRIFNKSIFDISANLRIPIDAVKRVVEDLSLQNLLTKNFDGTYSGLFRWVMTNPVEVFKTIQVSSRHLAEETGAGIKSTLFGGIRFSGLRAVENNPFLRALQRGNVRFLSRLHFDQDGLRSVATNMKIFGWNVYDIANVLALRAQEVKALVDEGFASMHLMSYRLGFTKLDDAIPNWDRTVETMRKMFSSSIEGEGPVSRAEALDRVVTAMGNKFTNPVDERALRYLADILPSDGPRQIQLKLLHLRNWINNVEAREGIVYRDWSSSGVLNPFGFQGLPPGVKAEYLEVYQKIGKAAQHLTMDDLIAKSHEMYRKGRHMRLVDPLAPIKGGFDLDYYFGRFQTYFIARGEALAVIQRNWERLVTNFEIATRKFVPTSYSVTRLEPEQYATIANWKRLAVEESPTSFRVGETRFFIELFDEAEQMLGPNTLLNAVDDDFVKESLRLQLYTRKRFPNLEDMPGIRITTDRAYVANAGQFSYLQGNINVHAEWAFNYAKTQADVSDIIRYEARSGVVPTGRRYTGDNIFDRLMLHETAHWLTDHLTEAEIHELVDVIADRTSLNLHWITNPKYIEQRLTDIAALPFDYKTRDPLGSSFMAWRRQVVLRDELRINQAPNNLRAVERNIVRITGEYGAMNIDEMISENMSHYLYHRDPTNLSRIIGGFYDEKLLGRQAARMVDQARPVGGEVVADQRDVIERVFNHEVPSNMTDDFKKRALRIARTFDGEEDTAQAMQEALFPYRHYQGETLDTSVLHYWAEDNSQVTTIRAAWEEMHGIARPEVAYNDRDVAAAIHLDKMWEKYSYPDKKKMFRGITYETVGNTPQQAHAEELMKVGNTFELPFSSFTEEDWMAATYSHLDKPFTRGIFVELEGGAQRLPVVDKDFGLADLTATTVGRNLEALTKGTFEVVSVTPRWTPSKRVIENLIKEYGLELDFSDEELEEQKAEFSQMMQDKVTKVVLRRVVDTVSPRVGG